MSVNSGPEIVGIGAGGALDFYLPKGVVGPDFRKGAKIGWSKAADELLLTLISQGSERHVGGNAVNALAFLAAQSSMDVGLVGVLGRGDVSSESIRGHLEVVGIKNLAVTVEDALPSVSIIERRDGDRMVRGRPRTPLDPYLTDEYISQTTANAKIVVAASLKSADLASRVFSNTPQDAFLSYNPGSSEFRDHPGGLQAVMRQRRPDLLALNDEELQQLYGAPKTANVEDLATKATELAESVLCTLGAKGIILSRRLKSGQVECTHYAGTPLPEDKIEDTLGAGDRAHGVAIKGIFNGDAPKRVLRDVAERTLSVIQHTGAHGDLYAPKDVRDVYLAAARFPIGSLAMQLSAAA